MLVNNRILIRKIGESVSGIKNATVNKADDSGINFSYKKNFLAGVEFQVSVAEKIYIPDH